VRAELSRKRLGGGCPVVAVVLTALLGLGLASCGSAVLKTSGAGTGIGGAGGAAGIGGSGGSKPIDAAAGTGGEERRDATADLARDRGDVADATHGCQATCPAPTTGAGTGAGVCVNDACGIACPAAYPTLCSTSDSCVDTTSDGKNCGACGHDCLGGACTAGQCQPIGLAQYTGNLTTIFVGAQYVYATTDEGYIGRANKDGSDLKPFAEPGFVYSDYPGTTIAEDGNRAFFVWYNGSSIQLAYCSTSSCDATITPIGGPYTQYFAVDQTDHKIFWIDYSPTQLWSASTTGSTITGTALPGGALASGSSGSRLFYSQGGIFLANADAVERLSVSGGAFANVAGASTSLAILGANDSDLFLYDGTSIGYVPLPSGTQGSPTPLVTTSLSLDMGRGVAADDSSAYWANQTVQTCELVNCAATTKALPSRSVDIVMDVGIDDQAIYWGANSPDPDSPSTDGCTVWKLAK
jgi:hypothetical protein